jgi:hypothetical protein
VQLTALLKQHGCVLPVVVVGSGSASVGAAAMRDLGVDATVVSSPDLSAFGAFGLVRSSDAAFGAGKKGIKPPMPVGRILRFVCWALCCRCRAPRGKGSSVGDILQQGGVFVVGDGGAQLYASRDEHPGYPEVDHAAFLAAAGGAAPAGTPK